MGVALGWGLFAGSSLILGGVLALVLPIRERLLGLIMAFGAGVLISAVAYELVAEAFETSAWNGSLALGLSAGALTFFVGDLVVDRMGGEGRKKMRRTAGAGSALAIVLGIVLDGIPESAVIGLGLLEGTGVSVAVIAAVFLSNLPEAIAATTGLSASGWSRGRILGLWALVTLVSGLAFAVGVRGLRLGRPRRARVRPRFRRRGDPDDARRHDDARGVRARRQVGRADDDPGLRAGLRADDAGLARRIGRPGPACGARARPAAAPRSRTGARCRVRRAAVRAPAFSAAW